MITPRFSSDFTVRLTTCRGDPIFLRDLERFIRKQLNDAFIHADIESPMRDCSVVLAKAGKPKDIPNAPQ